MGDIADYLIDQIMLDEEDKEPEEIPFVRILRETSKAYRIRFDENFPLPKDEWIPKSQVTIDEDEEIVLMPEWLAIEKGLI